MSSQNSQNDFNELDNLVKKMKAELNERMGEITSVKDEVEAATKETDEAYKTWIAKRAARQEKVARLRGIEQFIKDAESELKEKERALYRKMVEAKESQDRVALFKQLDDLTRTAKWREWAFDYQIEGAKVLAVQRRGFLGDKRGSGKTLTSQIWLEMVQGKRVLIIIPKDVVSTFEGEIRKWTQGKAIVRLQGKNPTHREIILSTVANLEQFIITINYQAWRKDKTLIDKLIDLNLDTIICDEAHEINKLSTVQAKGVKRLVYTPNKCPNCEANHRDMVHRPVSAVWECKKCDQRFNDADPDLYSVKNYLAMSGTWLLNRPQELFTNLHMIDKNEFPSEQNFLRRYCYNVGGNAYRFFTGAEDQLFRKLGSRYIARKPQNTPPPVIQTHELDFEDHARQAEMYKRVSQAVLTKLEDGRELVIPEIITLILRLRQTTSWPNGIVVKDGDEILFRCDVDQSVKIDKAEKLAKELVEEGERVIVFSQFKTVLKELERRLGPVAVRFDGDTSEGLREQVKQDFHVDNTQPRWSVCLANYKTGGVGLNLNGASHVIMVDREWNPGKEDQAIGRVDRIGQKQQVNVHILQVSGTIDTWMDNLISMKDEMIQGFEGRGKELQDALIKSLRDSL